MALEITSDPEYRGGKYCFAGTRWWVASIKRNALSEGKQWVIDNFPGVTGEMIDAALAWEFPPLYDDPEYEPEWDISNVRCVCGERTEVKFTAGFAYDCHVCDACGKCWRVTVTVAEDDAAKVAASMATG